MAHNDLSRNFSRHRTTVTTFLYFDALYDVDPIAIVSLLYSSGRLSRKIYDLTLSLYDSGHNRKDIIDSIIDDLLKEVDSTTIINAIDKAGYDAIASKLYNQIIGATHAAVIPHASTDNRTSTQRLYRQLKRMVHDSQFKNPRQFLRALGKRFESKLQSERNSDRQQILADKYLSILGVEFDAFRDSTGYKQEVSQQEMLTEMMQLIPRTSNTLVSDTILYSRYANLGGAAGNISNGKRMLVVARNSAQGFGCCLEQINLHYMEVYFKLWDFESNPTQQNLEELLVLGRRGLDILACEEEVPRKAWTRMFLLRMVFGLLGIGNDANNIANYKVKTLDMRKAEVLLAEVDKNWEDIDVRREMMYCVARAKLNELHGMTEIAFRYLNRGKHLANDGGFLRKEATIDRLIADLHRKHTISLENSRTSQNTYSQVCATSESQMNLTNFAENERGMPPMQVTLHLNIEHDEVSLFRNIHEKRTDDFDVTNQFNEMNLYLNKEDKEHALADVDNQQTTVKFITTCESHGTNQTSKDSLDETDPKILSGEGPTNLSDNKIDKTARVSEEQHNFETLTSSAGIGCGENNRQITDNFGTTNQFYEMNMNLVLEPTDRTALFAYIQDSHQTNVKLLDINEREETCPKSAVSLNETNSKVLSGNTPRSLSDEKPCLIGPEEPHDSENGAISGESEIRGNGNREENIRAQLNTAFHECSNLGSIALFEERSVPEGASCPEP